MSQTTTSTSGRPPNDRPGEQRLLTAARHGDTAAVGVLCDQHGESLLRLAWAMLGDHTSAESAVIESLAQACNEPDSTEPDASLRHELARLTFTHCVKPSRQVDRLTTPHTAPSAAMAIITQVSALSRHQRGALALTVFGDHSYRETADVLGLTPAAVAGLLTSGLRDCKPRHALSERSADQRGSMPTAPKR